jgi:hypothetical protein
MTLAEMRRIEYTDFFTGAEGGRARIPQARSVRPIPIQEAVPVDVRVRPREAGFLYTQGLQVSDIAQDRIRPGLIMDCYA